MHCRSIIYTCYVDLSFSTSLLERNTALCRFCKHRKTPKRVFIAMMEPSLLLPEYGGTKLLTFTAIFVPTQIIAVGLRYFSRYLINGPWGLDDIVVLVSLLMQMCMAGLSVGELMSERHAYNKNDILILKRICPSRWSWLPLASFRTDKPSTAPRLGQIPCCNLCPILWQREHPQACHFGSLLPSFPQQDDSPSSPDDCGSPHLFDNIYNCYGTCCL